MDLLERDEREFLRAESGLKFCPVGKDVFAGVPFGEAEIKNFAAIEIRDAAGNGAEAMDEPWELVECFELKNF